MVKGLDRTRSQVGTVGGRHDQVLGAASGAQLPRECAGTTAGHISTNTGRRHAWGSNPGAPPNRKVPTCRCCGALRQGAYTPRFRLSAAIRCWANSKP